jgi:hypothetical protein
MRYALAGPDAWITQVPDSTGSVWQALQGWPRLARTIALTDIEAEYAANPRALSMAAIRQEWAEWGRRGGDERLRLPYARLLHPLVQPPQSLSRIYYRDPVVSVAQGRRGDRRIEVSTRAGRTYLAHCVIVTISLGILREHRLNFSPDLGDGKRAAIRKLGMGDVVKVVVRTRPMSHGRARYNFVSSDLPIPDGGDCLRRLRDSN